MWKAVAVAGAASPEDWVATEVRGVHPCTLLSSVWCPCGLRINPWQAPNQHHGTGRASWPTWGWNPCPILLTSTLQLKEQLVIPSLISCSPGPAGNFPAWLRRSATRETANRGRVLVLCSSQSYCPQYFTVQSHCQHQEERRESLILFLCNKQQTVSFQNQWFLTIF